MTAIDDKLASLGAVGTALGQPKGPELPGANGGAYRHFDFGSIFWHPDTGAHEVHGAIAKKYGLTGYEQGPLGYPTTDESDAVGGRFNHFQLGSVYWRPDLGAYEVHGEIHAAWASQGFERGSLRYPISDETSALVDSVRYSRFEGGTLAWDPHAAELGVQTIGRFDGSLLIVTPAHFRPALEPLVRHKRATGLPTLVVDTAAVSGAHLGRDDAEGIKRLIWSAWRALGVRYVLLVGDASLIPVRYRWTSNAPGWSDSWYTAADLYYAALTHRHDEDGLPPTDPDFDDWDANRDNRFDEHHWENDISRYNPDEVEGCADVALGRLPAHTAEQVEIYVRKVIEYETGRARAASVANQMTVLVDLGYDSSGSMAASLRRWSGADLGVRFVAVNGDPQAPLPAPGGTVPTSWSRGGDAPAADAASSSGWLFWVGHGHNLGWATSEGSRPLNRTAVEAFRNATNLPIVFAAGCSTGAFVHNPPATGAYAGIDGSPHNYGTSPDPVDNVWDSVTGQDVRHSDGAWVRISPPPPAEYDLPDASDNSFAGAWLFNPNGGGIAYFGEQTVAQNNWGVDLGAQMLTEFGGYRILGDMWLYGQQRYWSQYRTSDDPIGAGRIYLTYMTMFGDPSLRLQGVPAETPS